MYSALNVNVVSKFFKFKFTYLWKEENTILYKMYRQKVGEVKKLIQNVRELEEFVLAEGATPNVVRDFSA